MFTSVDPLASEMPEYSPYAYGFNDPINFVDPTGLAPQDIIDIEKSTGSITVTEAEGADQVRLVDNGSVVDSYEYGSNGSFSSENSVVNGTTSSGVDATVVISTNSENAEGFYQFAAKSNVEFAKIDVTSGGQSLSAVISSGEDKVSSGVPNTAKAFSNLGFTGVKSSHSHPDGQQVPSGHYANEPGNPYSLTPVPNGGGDARNARQMSALPGFGGTKFEVYTPATNTTTSYNGRSRAVISPR